MRERTNPHVAPGSAHTITFPVVPKRVLTQNTPSNPFGWAGFDNPTVVGDVPYGSAGAPVNPYHRSQQTGEE